MIVLVVCVFVAVFALAIYGLATTGTERDPASRHYVEPERSHDLDEARQVFRAELRAHLARMDRLTKQAMEKWGDP